MKVAQGLAAHELVDISLHGGINISLKKTVWIYGSFQS
jgi:hypothetical protein